MTETVANEEASGMPDRVVVILLDSLNRHMLGAYGGGEFDTPNLDRFAATSVRFDNHYTGSLPCMPARHDLLCGALDFLWKPWGSIELWEEPLTVPLRRAGVTTQLISDHPHLFETGGENSKVHEDTRSFAFFFKGPIEPGVPFVGVGLGTNRLCPYPIHFEQARQEVRRRHRRSEYDYPLVSLVFYKLFHPLENLKVAGS